jgi:ABC-type sugar transport system permease subunit
MQPRNVLTQTFIMQTIDIAITNNDIGLGSAMGVVLLMMVGIITLIQKLFERRMD